MGRYKEKETTSLSDMMPPPFIHTFEIEDTKTSRIGKGASYTKKEARNNAWKDLKFGEEPKYREMPIDRPISSGGGSGGGGGGAPLSFPGSEDLIGCLIIGLLLLGGVFAGLDYLGTVVIAKIETSVIKKILPAYETRAEKALRLIMEQMEREMSLNATPIQITQEVLPVNIIYENPFGTRMRPIRFSSGEKLYSLNQPKRNYGGPGGTIFIEDRYRKRLVADHTGFPCEGLAISPDEARIGYFLGTMRGATLRIIDKNGILIREFIHVFRGLPTYLSWSPHGNLITFSVQPNDGIAENNGIYIINIEDGKIQRLTNNGGHPVWLPGGNKIAFTFQNKIYIVNKNNYLVRRVVE